jgi:thiol-disulfide isomerase/thioredoxin
MINNKLLLKILLIFVVIVIIITGIVLIFYEKRNKPQGIQIIEKNDNFWKIKYEESTNDRIELLEINNIDFKLGNKIIKPTSILDKKIIILDFVASWCDPCKDDIKKGLKFKKQNPKFNFCYINAGDKNEETFIKFLEKNGIELEKNYIISSFEIGKNLLSQNGIQGLPSKMFLDKDKKIILNKGGNNLIMEGSNDLEDFIKEKI